MDYSYRVYLLILNRKKEAILAYEKSLVLKSKLNEIIKKHKTYRSNRKNQLTHH